MSRSYGCLEPKRDFRDYRVCKSVANMQLPEEFKLEPKTIKNQGSVSSCVAHSLSSYLELSDSNNIVYSTGWIYGYRPVGYYQGEGMYMREAIKTLQQQNIE